MATNSQKIILKTSDGFENIWHGTDIFKNEPCLMDEIAQWLKGIYFAV